jgi:N utilization substance protein B
VSGLPVIEPGDEVEVEEIDPVAPANERSLARRIALQVLYEIDSVRHPADEVLVRQLEEAQAARSLERYVRRLVEGVLDNHTEIDDAVAENAPEFPLEQIAFIDRNILRIALYEFAVSGHVPVSAAINEAVELAKLFGADTAPAFINGVLGTIASDAQLMQDLNQASDEDEDDT